MRKLKIRHGLMVINWAIYAFIGWMLVNVSISIVWSVWPPLFDSAHLPKEMPVPRVTLILLPCLAIFNMLLGCIPMLIFKKFVNNIRAGETFTNGNIRLLKQAAVFLLVFGAIGILHNWLFEQYISIPYNEEVGNIIQPIHLGLIFFALFILVLLYILSAGIELQNDKDLTI